MIKITQRIKLLGVMVVTALIIASSGYCMEIINAAHFVNCAGKIGKYVLFTGSPYREKKELAETERDLALGYWVC